MERPKAELMETVAIMRGLTEQIYWQMFRAEIGWRAHPFLEFNGLLGKYVDVCAAAAEKGIPFPDANIHTGIPLPVEVHDLVYLAEKLGCIFGPIIRANPEARAVFAKELLGIDLADVEPEQ